MSKWFNNTINVKVVQKPSSERKTKMKDGVSKHRVLRRIHLPMGERRMTRSGASSGENDSEVRGKLGVTMGPQILKLKSVESMTR